VYHRDNNRKLNVQGFSDWADPYSLPGSPRVYARPTGDASNPGNAADWNRYAQSQSTQAAYKAAFPSIEVARLMSEAATIKAPAEATSAVMNAGSLGQLRTAQSTATVLNARTKNLKTTSDVSQEVQKPVQATLIGAAPWLIGGGVAIGLIMLILYRTRK